MRIPNYSEYNCNTLSNYLSKDKIAYDHDLLHVERKEIIAKPKPQAVPSRAIAPVLRRVKMKDAQDEVQDWQYWLSQPVVRRAEAVTFLVNQMLAKEGNET